MAQQYYKVDLQNTIFSLLSTNQTRTIIGSVRGEAPAATDRPGLAYGHNILPTKEGINSVGYVSEIPAILTLSPGDYIADARIIYSTTGTRTYLAFTNIGEVYALEFGEGIWTKLASNFFMLPGFNPNRITTAIVNRVSYIFYYKTGAVTYNSLTNTLNVVEFSALNPPNVVGIVGSSGYLIAYTETSIAWSSLLNPTDFLASEVTGAGSGSVADIAGNIIFAVANPVGIILYTEANAVAATHTGNSRFPFKIREVPSSNGGINLDLVAHEANANMQFVFSKAGLQTVTSNEASILLPEITDFLAGRVLEDYDPILDIFIRTDLTTTMLKKIKYVGSRYLIISYGIDSFTHALVLDTALQKLGKLKIAHTDVIEYIGDQQEVSSELIGIVLASGEIKVVTASEAVSSSSGVAIFGKIQYDRGRNLQLQHVQVESVDPDDIFTLRSLVSMDGKNPEFISEGYLAKSNSNFRQYNFRTSGVSHNLVLAGKFNLSTLQITYVSLGKR